jgi:hypothetical protein
MTYGKSGAFVLAVHPNSRGFGFVLFESPLAPFDWGARVVRGRTKNQQIVHFVERMIDQYRPVALVLEDWRDDQALRGARIRTLCRQLEALARKKRVRVRTYAKERVRLSFGHGGRLTRYDIAVDIAKQIPAFSYQLPPIRKAWMCEDVRQALYDAAALGVTFYGDEYSD